MKKIKFLSLLTLSFLMAATSFAQTADEIVSKHIEAIGGAENWKKIKNMKQEAVINFNGNGIPVTITSIHDYAAKQEVKFNGMTQFSIIRKDSGWSFDPMMGQKKPEPLTADDLKNQLDQLDLQGELIDYKLKGHFLEEFPKEDVEGTECYVLRITRKSGTESVLYFDPKTYYLVRSKSKIEANGQTFENVINMSDFRKLPEGIMIPYSIQSPMAPAPITIVNVIINGEINKEIFRVTL